MYLRPSAGRDFSRLFFVFSPGTARHRRRDAASMTVRDGRAGVCALW